MKYDYSFFRKHRDWRRKLRSYNASEIDTAVSDVFSYPLEEHGVILEKVSAMREEDEMVIAHCNGVHVKGPPTDLERLKKALNAELPEDFLQFYAEFGESLLITRTLPLWLWGEGRTIEEFEDDPDIDIEVGRFFRFANYPSESNLYFGFRMGEETNRWQVVWCTYGLLYSEMLGPEGREQVIADSFYDWLKEWVETDGYPDRIYTRHPEHPYLEPVD